MRGKSARLVGVHGLLYVADGNKNIVLLFKWQGDYRAVIECECINRLFYFCQPNALFDISQCAPGVSLLTRENDCTLLPRRGGGMRNNYLP